MQLEDGHEPPLAILVEFDPGDGAGDPRIDLAIAIHSHL